MTLTMGTGPFGPQTRGSLNFERLGPAHVLYFEDCPWRMRCELAGEVIADSRRVKLLHETGLPPVYYFPRDDVRFDLLRATEHTSHCPYKGDASYWSIAVGDRVVANAVWGYPSPLPSAPPIADHVAFYWGKLDRWLEEDAEAFVHARDPYHRVDVMPSSRHVRLHLDGTLLAESRRPMILFEAGLPPRYYLQVQDVRLDLLRESKTRTRCPYKGRTTAYWSFGEHRDIAWSYGDPLPGAAGIAGLVCFYDEKMQLELA
jgi:uncharacterized protein (DUF427 family)